MSMPTWLPGVGVWPPIADHLTASSYTSPCSVRRTAAAIRDAAEELGYPDVIAPPTFVFTVTFAAARQVIDDPKLGLDYSRVVHGDQRFTYSRPVRAGDRLSVVSTIESVTSRAGHDFIEVRGEVHDEAGEHVVTAWTKLVSRAAEKDREEGRGA